ncbi:MAG: DUF882 domain-containing protein [Deltaproteobacteria bacterium]|nr:DUF882 domain-containing protein [Deltaproteobacteria bacterium]
MTGKALSLFLFFFLVAVRAHADPLPKKLAELAAKQESRTRQEGSRAHARKLSRLVGKKPEPVISLRNTWTDEVLVVPARKGYRVDPATWSRFLRCHHTNQARPMEARLVQVLIGAALAFQKSRVDIVSGYRAPKYNLTLRKKGHEVARNSQHVEGNAVDFRVPGVTTRALHRFVRAQRLGGVGIYRESAFVHADTGPIRSWAGR